VIFLDNKVAHHPKFLKAGRLLGGQDGVARVVTLFIDALGYADQFLTDGKIGDEFVASSSVVRDGRSVAKVLSDRRIRLWHRIRGGYLIHDYHDWNRKANDVKEKREKDRLRKARWRAKQNGDGSPLSRAESRVSSARDTCVPRARATTHNRTQVPRTGHLGTSTAGVLTARFACGRSTETKNPTHRVLCAMLSAELAAAPSFANAIEGVKVRLARQGFAYPTGARLDSAIHAVERVRLRRGAA